MSMRDSGEGIALGHDQRAPIYMLY
jgi:hypothetical protein